MHTLLKVTKAKVWASMVEGRSFFASSNGRAIAERKSWGTKARDSSFMSEVFGVAEERYRRVL